MDRLSLRTTLGKCALINFGLLLIVWLLMLFANEWMYNIWSGFHSISLEAYDLMMISFVGLWKLLVVVFFVIPYFAIDAKQELATK